MTLRWRFVLILSFGALLPLWIVGLWLALSAERSGEELLRDRLNTTLSGIVSEIGNHWVAHRSVLLDIAEHPDVQRVMDRVSQSPSQPLRDLFASNQANFAMVAILDAAGNERVRLMPDTASGGLARRVFGPALPVTIGVYEPATGERIGTLQARVRWGSLVTQGAEWAGVAGSLLAAFEPGSGAAVLPTNIDPAVIRQPRFDWNAEPWVTVQQMMSEPPVELVLAAPLGPFVQPFAEATRRGTIALVMVAFATFVLVMLLTAGITRSLRRLAAAADAVAAGDLTQAVPASGGRELARVADAFNTMTENLRSTLRQLAQSRSLAAVGEFASALAHEVRNPLSSIRLDLQLAQEKLDEYGADELLSRALQSVDRLDRTVTGALHVARSGQVERKELDLRTVLDAAMHSAQPEFAKRHVTLEPPENATEPVGVNGDAAALEQVFLNLLLNAAQASHASGRTRVTLLINRNRVNVTVADDGGGIPHEVHKHMLEPFYSTKPDGTGLGLPVAHRIISAHGGSLTIDSHPSDGTQVTVTLPLTIASSEQ